LFYANLLLISYSFNIFGAYSTQKNMSCYKHEKVRILRWKHNLTQESLAKAIGTNQHIISRIESEKTKEPSLYIAYRIAVFFKLPMEEFINK